MDKIFSREDFKGDFSTAITPFLIDGKCEVTEDIYERFLEVLPPIYGGFCWGVGEPVRDNEQGQALYDCFSRRGGKYFYIGLKTVHQIREGK